MKKILFSMLILVPSLALADLATTTIVEPDITLMRIEKFVIHTDTPRLVVDLQLGYDNAGFRRIRTESISITNKDIMRDRTNIYSDDINDMMLDLPVAYQLNPATKILQEINAGTFGGQPTLKEYIEIIVKTLLKL